MALPDLTNQNIQDTYQRVVQTDGTKVYDGTGSLLPIEFDENNVIISGSLIAQTYVVSQSVINVSSGSTIFGNSGDDIHLFTGSISQSGHITASGNIEANSYFINNKSAINESDGSATVLADNNVTSIEIGRAPLQPNISFQGPITASGNIEASSYVSASEFRTTGHITASGNISSSVTVQAAGFEIHSKRISYDSTNNFIDIKDTGLDIQGGNLTLTSVSNGHITASGNISSSAQITAKSYKIDFNDAPRALFSEVNDAVQWGEQNITSYRIGKAGGPNTRINLQGSVTASGNISSSATIIARDINSLGHITASGRIQTLSHITASGDISSSGEVKAQKVTSKNASNHSLSLDGGTLAFDATEPQILFTQDPDRIYHDGTDIIISVNDEDQYTFKPGGLSLAGHISASGNISASSFITNGHITASGNISSSGTVITNKIDSNATSGNNTFETHILLAQDKAVAFGTTGEKITGDGTNLTINADGLITLVPQNTVIITGDISASGDLHVEGHLTASGINSLGGITASGDVSASGNIVATGFITSSGRIQTLSHITASGNISASGDIYGDRFYSNNVQVVRNNGDVNYFGKTGVPTELVGNVTASGNISASSTNGNHILGGDLTVMDDLIVADISASGTISGSEFYLPKGGRIIFDTQNVGAPQTYIGSDTATSENLLVHSDANIQLQPDFDVIIYEGSTQYAVFDGGDRFFQIAGDISASGDLHVEGHITASGINSLGGITASGNISASGNIVSTGFISSSHYGSFTQVTASGNISASGDISATGHITASGNMVVGQNLDVTGEIECDHLNIHDIDDGIHFNNTKTFFIDASFNVNLGIDGNSAVDLELYGFNHTYTAGSGITLDAVQSISLDSAAGDIYFKDSGTSKLHFDLDSTSGDVDIGLTVAGDDLVFKTQGDSEVLRISDTGSVSFSKRAFSKTGTTDAEAQGDIVYFGAATSMDAGKIYAYGADGSWHLADADHNNLSGSGLLAVALGGASDANGMLLRGTVTLDHDPGAVGDVLYLSTTAGQASSTVPSGNGDIVRVIGYCLDASNGQIWFNPDNTFVEVNA